MPIFVPQKTIHYLGEDLGHWVLPLLDFKPCEGEHSDAVGGKLPAEEHVHQVDLQSQWHVDFLYSFI